MWLYLLESKEKCFKKFNEFKAFVKMQSEYKIKTFWSDNDEELVSRALNYFLNNHGIKNQKSTLYTP